MNKIRISPWARMLQLRSGGTERDGFRRVDRPNSSVLGMCWTRVRAKMRAAMLLLFLIVNTNATNAVVCRVMVTWQRDKMFNCMMGVARLLIMPGLRGIEASTAATVIVKTPGVSVTTGRW